MPHSIEFELQISQHTTRDLKDIYPGEFNSWANRKYWAKKHSVAWDTRLASFKGFLRHMGAKTSSDATLDRKNPLGDYTLENLRWADKHTQTHNRTNTLSVPAYGRNWPIAQVADRLGLTYRQSYDIFRTQGSAELRRQVTQRKFELTFEFPAEFSWLESEFEQSAKGLTRLDWAMTAALERRKEVFEELEKCGRFTNFSERLELNIISRLLVFFETYRRWAKHMEQEESEGSRCFDPEWGWELNPDPKPALGDMELANLYRVTPDIFSNTKWQSS